MKSISRRVSRVALALSFTLAIGLAACGGGGSDHDAPAPVPVPDPVGAGELKSATLLSTIPASSIAQALASEGLQDPRLNPVYGVTAYRIEYLTSDAQGNLVRASGLVGVPVKPAGAKSPVLAYQHATIFHDAEAPSNHAVDSEISIAFASLGYIVAAPDLVGYGTTAGQPHPYLLATPSANAVADFLTAVGTWRQHNNVADNGQLFMTGYSEGAYVTMAAHRAMQAGNSPSLASLRMVITGAGPYDVQATFDGLEDEVRAQSPVLAALISPGLLRFLSPSVRSQVRAALVQLLLPGDTDVVFDLDMFDYYLADDTQSIAQLGSVYNWKPNVPVLLFHGRDDLTVPYASSVSTLQAMQHNGAGNKVSLTDCPAVPAGHIACVPSFLVFMLTNFAAVATDL